MSLDKRQLTISGIWRDAPMSIENVLQSVEYRALIDAGLKDARLFVLFPINSRFLDVEQRIEFFFCRDRDRLVEMLTAHLPTTSVLIPIVKGMCYFPQAFDTLAARMTHDDVHAVAFNTVIGKNGSRHNLCNETTPWNVALRGQFVIDHTEPIVDFLIENDKTALQQIGACIYEKKKTAQVENHLAEKEYRVWTGKAVELNDLQSGIETSEYLLSEYVTRAVASGNPMLVNDLSYDLLHRVKHFPKDDQLVFNRLGEMVRLFEAECWEDLVRIASDNISLIKEGDLRQRSLLFRAVAYVNLNLADQALSDLNYAIEADSENAAPRFLAGKVLMTLNRFNEAAALFRFCAEKDRFDSEALRFLFYCHYRTGNHDEAIKILDYRIKVFDYDVDYLRFLLHTSYMAGRMDVFSKYTRYIEPYPPIPASFPEKEWLLIFELTRRPKRDRWFVDVGANVGRMSRLMLSWGHKCLSVEPDDELLSELNENLSRYRGRAIVCGCACSSQNGEAHMTIGTGRGFNTLERDIPRLLNFRYDPGVARKAVEIRRLEELLAGNGIDDIALLKIDVEGHELEVLKGLDWRTFERIDHIFFEIDLRLWNRAKAAIYYLFGCGFQHGLIFQHPNQALDMFHVKKLTADEEGLTLNPENGVYGNALLSKTPFFSFDEEEILKGKSLFSSEEVLERLIR